MCVLLTYGAAVSQVLYNTCESVAVSSAPPGVFVFPLWTHAHYVCVRTQAGGGQYRCHFLWTGQKYTDGELRIFQCHEEWM